MRAYEVAKNGAEIQRGLIMMAIDGPESEVRQVEKILDAQFENTMCEEEGARGEELSITYSIDRADKADFMAAFKAAKAA